MWWNLALGGSMLVSSVSSFISTVGGLMLSSNNSGNQTNNSGYKYNSNFINQDRIFLRLSKYPSKSTIGYGVI